MRLAAFWLALLPASAALVAQTAGERLDIEQLTAEAMRRNPEIRAAQKKYEAAVQRPAEERALPDPFVSFGWNASGNPLPGAGLGSAPVANIGAMISQEVPYPGKLRLRAEIASKEAEAEAQQYRATSLNVISRLKQAYHRLHHAYEMTELLEQNRELLRSLLRTTEARYAVGKAPQADVFRAQTQLTLIETKLIPFEREKRTRTAEIDSLLNRPEDVPLGRPADMVPEPLAFSVEDLLAKARESAPVLAREQKMVERAGSALNLARKDNYPDFVLNGGVYSMGSMPAMYMFRADVKLPVHRAKTRAEITERTQSEDEAKHNYEAAARSLEYRIRDDYSVAQTAEKLMKLYEGTLLPQARLTSESALSAYSTGTADFASVLASYVAAIDYEMDYHEQMQEYFLAMVRLEEMTGVRLAH
jgi:cobalt-zinc-cadmium efflux system outer membrane protein